MGGGILEESVAKLPADIPTTPTALTDILMGLFANIKFQPYKYIVERVLNKYYPELSEDEDNIKIISYLYRPNVSQTSYEENVYFRHLEFDDPIKILEMIELLEKANNIPLPKENVSKMKKLLHELNSEIQDSKETRERQQKEEQQKQVQEQKEHEHTEYWNRFPLFGKHWSLFGMDDDPNFSDTRGRVRND